ncbi:FUSC family protein [Oleiharenicola lentus]|uniref:FUSC family protein n=1 Tax=Oleiharenicola lentus TaxID=2508720 RepID=UPI003F66F210
MNALVVKWRDYVERERLQPDLSRAMRATLGFMGPMLAVQFWHLPVEASFAAIAAQNIAMVDVRGSYPLRLSLLLAMTAVLAGSVWLGGVAGDTLLYALVVTAIVTGITGVWRHLSMEYGASLAAASGLLFLISIAHPEGDAVANRHFLATLAGGFWGLAIQGSLWPFRAQHPLRRTVADSWLALSDLLEVMAPDEKISAAERHRAIIEKQALLRTALDQATATLAAVPAAKPRPYLKQLDDLNMTAARLATRFMAFNVSLENVMEKPAFASIAPSFSPLITSLTNTARTVALTIVSRQPSHFASFEVRLTRLENLLQALQERVLAQTDHASEGTQLTFILRQISALLPAAGNALRSATERADEHTAFSRELFDVKTWTLRPLASALNLQWRPDPALLRFVARLTVIQLIGVGIFKYFNLQHGYWLPLTVLVVLQPDYGSTRLRASQRLIGTLAGSVVASGVLWLSLPPGVLFVAMAATMFGFAFWLKRNYSIAVFFITLFVVLITEISTKVTLAFTLERLAATASGGVLALVAALLFWPVWERKVFPRLLARALRANRDFLTTIDQRLHAGGTYDEPAIQAKRAAEVANSFVFSSLQRMSADPKNQQTGIDAAAALANGNQRLTQSLTVVALHLNRELRFARPELHRFSEVASEILETLAHGFETHDLHPAQSTELRQTLNQIALTIPPDAKPAETTTYLQFSRCATELGAMLLAIDSAQNATTPPFEND